MFIFFIIQYRTRNFKYKIVFHLQQLAMAVSAAQQAAVNQAKHEAAYNHAMMQRFPRPPMMAMPGTTVTSMPLVMRPMISGPPTFVGANLMRPPPLGMPPGMCNSFK